MDSQQEEYSALEASNLFESWDQIFEFFGWLVVGWLGTLTN